MRSSPNLVRSATMRVALSAASDAVGFWHGQHAGKDAQSGLGAGMVPKVRAALVLM